jgi:FtsP/CotA-like multicopper oxidase with cupredoxin domain
MTRRIAGPRLSSAVALVVLALSLAEPDRPAIAAEVAFMLPIANGRVPENMRRIRVRQHDVVKLHWTSDVPTSIHLHGYDIEKTVSPGGVTEMTFIARAAGRFTVESHVGKTASGGHAHGDVLVTIEVYP